MLPRAMVKSRPALKPEPMSRFMVLLQPVCFDDYNHLKLMKDLTTLPAATLRILSATSHQDNKEELILLTESTQECEHGRLDPTLHLLYGAMDGREDAFHLLHPSVPKVGGRIGPEIRGQESSH